MSFLKKLFGGGGSEGGDASETVIEHGDFRIYPAPQKDAGGFRIAARIEMDVNGETKVHQMIRADTVQGAEEAEKATVDKAKQVIDQLGKRLFN